MPAFIKTKEDKTQWERAKNAVVAQYGDIKTSDPTKFYSIATTIYKSMCKKHTCSPFKNEDTNSSARESGLRKLLEDIEKRNSVAEGIDPGKTIEKDKLRIHRYFNHVDVTDLTNAGKKGKMVRQFRVTGMGDGDEVYDSEKYAKFIISMGGTPRSNQGDEDFKKRFLDELVSVDTYDKALKVAQSYLSIIDAEDKIEQWEIKGIKVPVGKKDLNGAGVSISFDSTDFMIQNEKDPNLSTIIPRSKEAIKKFFTFMSNEFTQKRISKMSYGEIRQELDKQGIDYRSYLAMD